MTVLLVGEPAEAPLARAATAAADLGVDHAVVDPTDPAGIRLVVRVTPDGLCGEAAGADGGTVVLERVRGAYFRLGRSPGTPAAAAATDLLGAWADLAPCRVANRPSAMAANTSKPHQSRLIAQAGFAVPATLVTNDPEAVRTFAAAHGRVVYKSASAERSIVAELTPDRMREVDRVRWLPTQFQAYVAGVDLRVHVVGRQVFACEVRSAAVDYRYAAREGQPVELVPVEVPAGLAAACVGLARGMGLRLAGIDLRRRPDGSLVCFEVNPSPAYSWYEDATGQPIARALVRHLASVDR